MKEEIVVVGVADTYTIQTFAVGIADPEQSSHANTKVKPSRIWVFLYHRIYWQDPTEFFFYNVT